MDKSRLEQCKQRLFKFLHHPNTKWSHVYHSVVATVYCTYSIMVTFCVAIDNSADDNDDHVQDESCNRTSQITTRVTSLNQTFTSNSTALNSFAIIMNTIFAGFLLIELLLRLWSSTHIHFYSLPKMKGSLIYFQAHFYRRALDIFGIVVYFISIIAHSWRFNANFINIIRTFQIFQIYQANRILFSYMRIIWYTLFGYQQQYLAFTFVLAFMILNLSSIVIFLTERYYSNTQIKSIFDSFWFIYQTFTTIGYGDIVPKNWLSKVFVCFLAVFGVFTFALPACIIGTSLSIKMHQDYKKTLKYRKAVRLIQTIWRCRIINMALKNEINSAILWRSLVQHTVSMLNRKKDYARDKSKDDLYCISFIWKLKYKMAHYRFKRQNINMSSYSDVSQQYAEIWQRIDYIENDLSTLSDGMFKCEQKMIPLRATMKMLQDELDLKYRYILS